MNSGLLRPRTMPGDRLATIGALFQRSVADRPDAAALATVDETLSYAQLDATTAAWAGALVAAGAGKGSRIALLAPDGVLWVTVFLAATRIGALLVAVSTLATAPELAHVIRHSDAQILIGVRGFLRNDYVSRLETAFPGLASHSGGPLHLNEVPFLRSIWLDDASGAGWARSHADLLALPAPGAALIAAMGAEVAPSDDAVIIYTSGTSSLPKAVVHTQRGAAQQCQVMAEHFVMRPQDRLMPLLPAFWVGGLTMLIEVLGTGGTLVYPLTPRLDDVIQAVQELAVNRINSWGPQIAKIRAALAAAGIDPDTIGGIAPQCGPDGRPIPPGLAANMLGMTESFGPHSSEPLGTVLPEQLRGASGRATLDYERRIVDPATGAVLGVDAIGELQLRRGGLMRGFYKVDPDLVFTPDGFYPTGDTARIDAAGYLYFHGRRSDVIKTAGANVSRLEVEAALHKLPQVSLPIVLPLDDADAGQIVVAAVVPASGQSPTGEGLRAALRDHIAAYKIPRHIVILTEDEVPWTPSNKIKLGLVAELIAQRIGHDNTAKSAA